MELYLYDDLYQVEDKHWWHIAKRALVKETLLRYFPPTRNIRLLDVGCGAGRNLVEMKPFTNAYGIDISATAVAYCKKRGLKHVKKANVYKLPYRDHFFDMVTMLDVLEHVNPKALKEVRRVLKPNGVLLITVPAFSWLWSAWDEVLHHRTRYTKQLLLDETTHYKLRPMHISFLYSFLVLPVLVVRKIKALLASNTSQYESDFRLSHPLLNTIGSVMCALERVFFWKTGIPIGTTIAGIFTYDKE